MKRLFRLTKDSIFLLFLLPVVTSTAMAATPEVPANSQDAFNTVYAATVGSTTQLVTLPDRPISGGTFTFDVVYDDNVAEGIHELYLHVRYDQSVLEYVDVSNINTDGATHPDLDGAAGQFMLEPETGHGVGRNAPPLLDDDGDAFTDTVLRPTWSDLDGSFFNSSPVRLLTLEFRWRTNADRSTTNIVFTTSMDAARRAFATFRPTTLTIPGPPVVAPPSAPRNLVATAVFDNQIDVRWEAPLSSGCASSSCKIQYQVERSTSDTFTVDHQILESFSASVSAGATSLEDKRSIATGTDYYYRVAARNTELPAQSSTYTVFGPVRTQLPQTITLTATPRIISENGGAQTIFVTAEITGGQPIGSSSVVSSLTVTLIITDNRASLTNPIDFTTTTSVNIVIPKGERFGSTTFMITPTVDKITNEDTLITISGTTTSGTTASTVSSTAAGGAAMVAVATVTLQDSVDKDVVAQLHNEILSRFTQVVVASTNRSVESRIDATFSAPQTANYLLDGNTLRQKLPAYVQSLADDSSDWKRMLGNSSFVLPLNATGGDAGNAGEGVTVWGSGDYTNMSGKNTKGANLDWDGNVTGFQLGIDGRSDDLLTGGLVSFSKGSAKYTQDDVKGTYEHKMTSVHPYLAWTNGSSALWGSAGYGRGKVEIDHDGDKGNAKTTMLSLSGGVKSKLARQGMSVKGDISLVRTQVGELTGDVQATEETVKSQQLRVILESAREHTLESGGTVTPVLEVGLRYDGGSAGESGIGAILGAGVRYANATGLTAEGKVHALLGRKDYKEWGVSGTIRKAPRVNQRGLSFSLSPSYGHTGSKAEQIWDQKLVVGDDDKPRDDNMRVKVRLDYGLPAPGINGLLILYSEITVGEKSDRYLFGIHWKRSSSFSVNVSGERKGSAKKHVLGATWKGSIFDIKLTGEREEGNTVKHRILLESIIRF